MSRERRETEKLVFSVGVGVEQPSKARAVEMFKHAGAGSKKVHYLQISALKKESGVNRVLSMIGHAIRQGLACIAHYTIMTVLLLSLKFRSPALLISAAYCLNFFFSHDRSLWIDTDFSALWVLAGCIYWVCCGRVTDAVEENKPFHGLLKVRTKSHKFEFAPCLKAANDDFLGHD